MNIWLYWFNWLNIKNLNWFKISGKAM